MLTKDLHASLFVEFCGTGQAAGIDTETDLVDPTPVKFAKNMVK